MKIDRPFFDTHVLLYLLSEDNRKADQAGRRRQRHNIFAATLGSSQCVGSGLPVDVIKPEITTAIIAVIANILAEFKYQFSAG